MSDENGLTGVFTFRISKRDLALLEKIAEARGEDASTFVRRAMRQQFAALNYLTDDEKKALGTNVR